MTRRSKRNRRQPPAQPNPGRDELDPSGQPVQPNPGRDELGPLVQPNPGGDELDPLVQPNPGRAELERQHPNLPQPGRFAQYPGRPFGNLVRQFRSPSETAMVYLYRDLRPRVVHPVPPHLVQSTRVGNMVIGSTSNVVEPEASNPNLDASSVIGSTSNVVEPEASNPNLDASSVIGSTSNVVEPEATNPNLDASSVIGSTSNVVEPEEASNPNPNASSVIGSTSNVVEPEATNPNLDASSVIGSTSNVVEPEEASNPNPNASSEIGRTSSVVEPEEASNPNPNASSEIGNTSNVFIAAIQYKIDTEEKEEGKGSKYAHGKMGVNLETKISLTPKLKARINPLEGLSFSSKHYLPSLFFDAKEGRVITSSFETTLRCHLNNMVKRNRKIVRTVFLPTTTAKICHIYMDSELVNLLIVLIEFVLDMHNQGLVGYFTMDNVVLKNGNFMVWNPILKKLNREGDQTDMSTDRRASDWRHVKHIIDNVFKEYATKKEVPKPTEEVPKPTEEVPKPAEEVIEPTEEVPNPTEEVIEPTEEVPKPTEEVTEPTEEVPKPTEEDPKPTEEVPKPAKEDPEPIPMPYLLKDLLLKFESRTPPIDKEYLFFRKHLSLMSSMERLNYMKSVVDNVVGLQLTHQLAYNIAVGNVHVTKGWTDRFGTPQIPDYSLGAMAYTFWNEKSNYVDGAGLGHLSINESLFKFIRNCATHLMQNINQDTTFDKTSYITLKSVDAFIMRFYQKELLQLHTNLRIQGLLDYFLGLQDSDEIDRLS